MTDNTEKDENTKWIVHIYDNTQLTKYGDPTMMKCGETIKSIINKKNQLIAYPLPYVLQPDERWCEKCKVVSE